MTSRVLPLPLLLAATLAAGCGGGSGATPSAASAVDPGRAAGVAFATCMRAHGVPNFPDPTRTGGGGLQIQMTPGRATVNGVSVNGPAFRSAMSACHSKLPNGRSGGPVSASQRAAALRFSACMRAHGLPSFPDPKFAGGGVQIALGPGNAINPASPAFNKAQAACGSLIGRAGPGGPKGG